MKGIIRVLSVLICLSLAAAMSAAAESGMPRQGKGQRQNPGNGQGKGGRGGFAPSESEVAAQEEGLQRAYNMYLEANELYSDDIGGDLSSPQAASNVAAFEKWWEAAYDYGFIPAATKIFDLFDGSSGGFVKDAVTNEQVAIYGRGMGNNPGGKSGWQLMRELGERLIEQGWLDDLNRWGNSASSAANIYEWLAVCYGDDECLGVEPWAADYDKALTFYLKELELGGSFKTGRYIAELYWYGHVAPPEGKTVSEVTLEYMQIAIEARDATPNFYLGEWYLSDGSDGSPALDVPEGETRTSMAVRYLEQGRAIADHGTIRRTMEGLQLLADIYEYGTDEAQPDLEKALDVYQDMLGEAFYPGIRRYEDGVARIEAKQAAAQTGEIVVLVDDAPVELDTPVIRDGEELVPSLESIAAGFPGYEMSYDEGSGVIRFNTPDGYHPGDDGEIVADEGETVDFAGQQWLVLEKRDDCELILLADVLEDREFHGEYTQIIWETSDMRAWLNGAYLDSFSAEDRARILPTRIAKTRNARSNTSDGPSTEDHIFLLSLEEVEAYFGDGSEAAEPWWTRTPGIDQRLRAVVGETGTVNTYGWRCNNPLGGVRPAMWISLESE